MSPKTRRMVRRNEAAERRALLARCLASGEVGTWSGVRWIETRPKKLSGLTPPYWRTR